jgi:hypothetical protein
MLDFLRILGTVVIFGVSCAATGALPVFVVVLIAIPMIAVAAHQHRGDLLEL